MTNKAFISFKTKQQVLSKDKFKCQKCGHYALSEELEVHHVKMRVDQGKDEIENLVTLCSICHHYAPNDEKDFEEYLKEKIDGTILDTFRKSQKSIAKRTKKGMTVKFQTGAIVTRPPLGYKFENKQLILAENSFLVQEIFQEFLNTKTSLTQLAKKYELSVNGLKKVLSNQTYLGKIKFDGQTHQGLHQPLISSTLFNHVQNKLKEILKN